MRLVRSPDFIELDPEEAARVQDAHLAFLHEMWRRGQLLAAGPAVGSGEDHPVRGFAVMSVNVERSRALWREDPGVRARRFEAEISNWLVPKAMIVAGDGVPPTSTAEVRG